MSQSTSKPDDDAISIDDLRESLWEEGEDLIDQGFDVIPCDGKRPMGRGWQNSAVSAERLQTGLDQAANPALGVVMGPRSGLVDLEIDSDDEEDALNDLFRGEELPHAGVYRSPRGSHHIFAYDQRLDVITKATVTYRSEGGTSFSARIGNANACVSIFPPSPSREWTDDGESGDVVIPSLPDVVIERLIEADRGPGGTPASPSTSPQAPHSDRIKTASNLMLDATRNMTDGNDGSRRLITQACRAVELDLSDAEALAAIRACADKRPFPTAWTDAQIMQRIADAEDMVERGAVSLPASTNTAENRLAASTMDGATEAIEFLQSDVFESHPRLKYWSGSWQRWDNGKYHHLPNDEVRANLAKFLGGRYSRITSSHINSVLEQLRGSCLLPQTVTQPCWLDNPPAPSIVASWDPTDCLSTPRQVVHIPSTVSGADVFEVPAFPAYFTSYATDFEFDCEAPNPEHWLTFLSDLWGDAPENIRTLQEIFGYVLTPDTRQQKIFAIIGPKRSGKGTIARVFRALIGDSNVAGPTLSGLTSNFGLAPLVGKSLAIVSDARLARRSNQTLVLERLLSISGEDSLTIDRKYKDSITCKLPTRFLLLSNELPRFDDSSGAIASRFILLPTNRSFFGREDTGLTDRLLQELPGILLWAIQGWARLCERGHFVQPASGQELLSQLSELASPVSAFVSECCVLGQHHSASLAHLYQAWRVWCVAGGREFTAGSRETFARNLRAAVSIHHVTRPRTSAGRQRVYHGISLAPHARGVGPAGPGPYPVYA